MTQRDQRVIELPGGARALFTGVSEGNLGLHVGEPSDGTQENRRRLERSLGLEPGSVLYLNQVHGTAVCDADAADPVGNVGTTPHQELDRAPTADAAVTSAGRPLAVMTADCLPVVFGTEVPGTFAVAHAGRRGLLDGVLPATVRALRERGAREIAAWIGPAVCGSCYEVPEAMAAESEQVLPGIRVRTSWGTPSLDLAGAAEVQLGELGVSVQRAANACTLEDEAFFSHRGAHATPGAGSPPRPEGRLAGIVWRSDGAVGGEPGEKPRDTIETSSQEGIAE